MQAAVAQVEDGVSELEPQKIVPVAEAWSEDPATSTADQETIPLTRSDVLKVIAEKNETPASFHQAATVIILTKTTPPVRRLSYLFFVVLSVFAQAYVIFSLAYSTGTNMCLSNNDCSGGFYCSASVDRVCKPCIDWGLFVDPWTNSAFLGRSLCSSNSSLTAELKLGWSAVRQAFEMPPADADYDFFCDGCFTAGETPASDRFTTVYDAITLRIDTMNRNDWVTLFFVSIVIAMGCAAEQRDIQLAAVDLQSLGHEASSVWHTILWAVGATRRFVVLSMIPSSVVGLVTQANADSLSICLNAVAVLFLLDLDDLIYTWGIPDAARSFSEEFGRPKLSATQARMLGFTRVAFISSLLLFISLTVWLSRHIEIEWASAMAIWCPAAISALVEAATLRSPQRFVSLALAAGLGGALVHAFNMLIMGATTFF